MSNDNSLLEELARQKKAQKLKEAKENLQAPADLNRADRQVMKEAEQGKSISLQEAAASKKMEKVGSSAPQSSGSGKAAALSRASSDINTMGSGDSGLDVASGAASGAAIGFMAGGGPVGAGVGAAVGGSIGYLKSKQAKKASALQAQQLQQKLDLEWQAQRRQEAIRNEENRATRVSNALQGLQNSFRQTLLRQQAQLRI